MTDIYSVQILLRGMRLDMWVYRMWSRFLFLKWKCWKDKDVVRAQASDASLISDSVGPTACAQLLHNPAGAVYDHWW